MEKVCSIFKKLGCKNNEQRHFDIRKILDTLPHRYPFILVDKVIPWSKRDDHSHKKCND